MEPLHTYLRETRTTPKAFAKIVGMDEARLARMLSGEEGVDAAAAQRMVDATGGALALSDLVDSQNADQNVLDLRGRFSKASADIDEQRLAEVLGEVLPPLVGGARRIGDDRLPVLAAEAAAGAYAALSTVTSRRGEARLSQALRPVFAEILAELGARPAPGALDRSAAETARRYFQAQPQARRA